PAGAAAPAGANPGPARVDPRGAPARPLEVDREIEPWSAMPGEMPPRLEPAGQPSRVGVDLDELVEVRALAHERGEAALDRHRDARRRERAAQGPQARGDVHD